MKNRDYFTLATKIIGLVIFSYGFVKVLGTVCLYFSFKNLAEFIPAQSQEVASLLYQHRSNDLFIKIIATSILTGIIPMLFGMYLMKSGYFFIQGSYPLPQEPINYNLDNKKETNSKKVDHERFMP